MSAHRRKRVLLAGFFLAICAPAGKAQTIDSERAQSSTGVIAVGGATGPNRPSQSVPPVIGGSTAASPFGSLADTTPPATPPNSPAQPLKAGPFTLAAGGTAGAFFDDNVFAEPRNRRSDIAFFARPELSAVARGGDYGLQASAFVEGRRYTKYSSEDQINAGASAAGVFEPDADTQVRARAQYLRGHEDRGIGESVFATLDRPVAFDLVDASAALNKRFGRWFTSFGVSTVAVFYRNSTLLGIPVDESYRNVVIPAVTARVGYVVAPLTSIFFEASGNLREFRFQPLSSSGFRTVAGLLFEPGPEARVKGEIFAGYMYQDYSGTALKTVSTFTAGGALSFLLTTSFVATVEGRREAKESGLAGGVSLIESSVGIRADYQLFENLVASAGATYLVDQFKGVARTDRYISPLAAVRYTISKNLTVGVDYRYLTYNPDAFGTVGFRRNVALASLNARF